MATKKRHSREELEYTLSRSEKKRRAKDIEQLAIELVELEPSSIKALPCDSFLQDEIRNTKKMKSGSRKRQLKFIAKNLRQIETEPLFDFLSDRKGSHLKKNKDFHELERLRDDIINDAIELFEIADKNNAPIPSNWQSAAFSEACNKFPNLDKNEIQRLAVRYARTHKINHRREIFRLLKSAQEQKYLFDISNE